MAELIGNAQRAARSMLRQWSIHATRPAADRSWLRWAPPARLQRAACAVRGRRV